MMIMMKKILLLVVCTVVCAVSCLFGCGPKNSQNTEFDPNDTGTWFDETSGAQIDILDVEKLKTGMTFDETVDLLGKPKRDIGSGVVIMEWDMVSGAHLNVFFVKQISGNSQNETTAESLIIEKWRIKE